MINMRLLDASMDNNAQILKVVCMYLYMLCFLLQVHLGSLRVYINSKRR